MNDMTQVNVRKVSALRKSRAVVAVPNTRTADDFASRINEECRVHRQRGFAFCIRVGTLLETAKAELRRGEFQTMVRKKLELSPDSARMFMRITAAGHLRRDEHDTKQEHAPVLPTDYTILDKLAKLDAVTFEAAVSAGRINPTMTRADAQALRGKEPKPKPAKVKTTPPISSSPSPVMACLADITLRLNDAIFPSDDVVMSDEDRRQLWRMITETWENLQRQVAAFKNKAGGAVQ